MVIDFSILLQNQLVSVRRILEYEALPSEAIAGPEQQPEKDVIGEWPHKGKIEFRNVCLKYAQGKDFALKGASFVVPGRSKVGVIGRTGAGKSTILQALFRLTEIEATGSILIDGVDTRSVDVHSLRSSLAYIP